MAFGNNDRINALGGNAGFWPEDDANVTAFPAMVNNLDMVQVTGAGSANGTATVVWGDETTWGFKFDGASDMDSNDWFNLMWGNGTYGATFSLGMKSTDNGLDGDLNSTYSNMGLGIGFGMNMDFGEIGVNFSTGSEDDGTDADQPSSMGLAFNLRRAQDVWLFDNMLVGFSMENEATGDMIDNDMGLSVDLFTSLPVGDGVDATFAMGFGYHANTFNAGAGGDDLTSSTITLPAVNLGVEADVTDWATVRFGVGHSYVLAGTSRDESTWMGSYTPTEGYVDASSGEWVEGEAQNNETPMTMDVSNFDWNFGLGFDYGSFTLDMVLNNTDLFNDPVRYVTGRNDRALSSSATLTWNF
tara:strand:+ start:555 stop:1625 length:1071 start_codon:yes stop_codon:yes gene_type:complete